MNFFIWRKNNVSFSKYLGFCDFVKSKNLKIYDIILDIAIWLEYTFVYAFWILTIIKMSFAQVLVCGLTCFWINAGDWNHWKSALSISLGQYSKISYSLFLLHAKVRTSKIHWIRPLAFTSYEALSKTKKWSGISLPSSI